VNSRSYRNPTTPIFVLIAINFLIFVATLFKPEAIDLLGISRSTFSSHWWTIVTAMFVHAGWWHIVMNMITLYFFGTWVSGLLGEVKFFIIYFLGGIVGNALFLLLSTPYDIAVGASGAVFALAGALVLLRPRLKVIVFPIFFPIDLWVAILIFCALSFQPGVGWQAHFGGLAVGLLAGLFFRLRERRRPSW
jgi:uncharacterized protein